MLDQKNQCLSLGFAWVFWKEKGKYLQNQDRLWEKHSVLIVCESMLLRSRVKERHSTLFVTPMKDCEVLKSQLKRVKWCPFPMLHLCLSGWEMRREESTAATVAQVFWAMKTVLTLDAARATVCFQRVDYPLCDLLLEIDTLSSSWSFLGQCHHKMFSLCQASKESQIKSFQRRQTKHVQTSFAGDYKNNWMKGKLI